MSQPSGGLPVVGPGTINGGTSAGVLRARPGPSRRVGPARRPRLRWHDVIALYGSADARGHG